MTIALSPKTEEKLTELLKDLPQSLLLTGEKGVGLATISRYVAGPELAAFIEPENSKGVIDHETGTISVGMIRRLYDMTRSKHTARQIIIIDDSEKMSAGAQGAFLKLLEEPARSIHFILTSHSPQLLLPTIRSRVQHIIIDPLTEEQSISFIKRLGEINTTKRSQLNYLANGLPAELVRLIRDEDYFTSRAEITKDARELLSASTYHKLLIVQKYYQSRSKALQLLDSALIITRRTISQKPQPALIGRLEQLLVVRDFIAANHNIRLQLTEFIL